MMSPKTKILVIEDEPDIAHFVREALQKSGCEVSIEHTLRGGLSACSGEKPDAVILDLGLPDGDGYTFVETIRTWSKIPVLILSARSNELEKIKVLDVGADDYLTKPFSIGELLARVRALLRRSESKEGAEENSIFKFGEVVVNRNLRAVVRGGESVHLTSTEYLLLCEFLNHEGRVMTHRQLMQSIWGGTSSENTHYLRIYVGHLRKKLELNVTQPKHFLTETGVGYRFVR